MNIIQEIKQSFSAFVQKTFAIDSETAAHIATTINADAQKQQFGDLSSNAAMVLAKALKKSPRDIANTIVSDFSHEAIKKIEIAGPGFLNMYLTQEALKQLVLDLYTLKGAFFKLEASTPKKRYNIEYVSANPTGPLHLGHGRGGIIGDVLSNILNFLGHSATKEYYINDAGNQMNKLGQSLKARCQEKEGLDSEFPENGYAGEYLIDLAKTCLKEYGIAVLGEPLSFFTQYAKEHLLAAIKTTLKAYGIEFDEWFPEQTLHNDGSIDTTLATLKDAGYLYEKDGALWFKSTAFGDDKDRVLKKSSGEFTYVAADSAYLKNKAGRGFDHMIMILGQDHHGYAMRLKGLCKALGIKAPLDVIFYQLVRMKSGGEKVRMSKRAGNIVTLEGVTETVGTDVARFFYLNRKADAQLEFDLDLALKKTDENPVYYAQYAYVRIKSILAKAANESALQNITHEDAAHIGPEEALLTKKIIALKDLLKNISDNYQTHLLTYYLLELAQTFHAYYGKNRVIDMENIPKSRARLLMISTLKETFEMVLGLLGISRPDKM